MEVILEILIQLLKVRKTNQRQMTFQINQHNQVMYIHHHQLHQQGRQKQEQRGRVRSDLKREQSVQKQEQQEPQPKQVLQVLRQERLVPVQ